MEAIRWMAGLQWINIQGAMGFVDAWTTSKRGICPTTCKVGVVHLGVNPEGMATEPFWASSK
eukprot:11874555-Prorocentrum_lima.AAC.1